MKVGFSGTRRGATPAQQAALRGVLEDRDGLWLPWSISHDEELQFHQGCCEGADVDAIYVATLLGYWIVGHPPDDDHHRAWTPCDELREPMGYLARDDNIVAETDVLVATPAQTTEVMRGSGTWATIRYARRREKPRILIWPNGSATKEGF